MGGGAGAAAAVAGVAGEAGAGRGTGGERRGRMRARVGMELERLRALAPALRRRVLRAAAEQLGCGLNFEQTERLMAMCGADRSGSRRQQLTAELRAERSARELRLIREAADVLRNGDAETVDVADSW